MFLIASLVMGTAVWGASLEKAKVLRQNGLLSDAKKELVELAFAADSTDDVKAEALMMLGDIAVDEKKYDVARENWNKALNMYPSAPATSSAQQRLKLLDQLGQSQQVQAPGASSAKNYPAGTVLVTSPAKYDWATLEVSRALGSGAVPFEGSLLDAVKMAGEQKGVVGIVELTLDTESLYESGYLICYRPNGEKVWQEKTRFNTGGGEERIARRFVDKLSERVKGRKCP
jgi:tetratricopeptide (TPR) repeat protein